MERPPHLSFEAAKKSYAESALNCHLAQLHYFDAYECFKSPIEYLMAEALLLMGSKTGLWSNSITLCMSFNAERRGGIQIMPQCPVGKYKVDFGIRYPLYNRIGNYGFLAVECDGHDFHEKTKEQAAHDKKRDRFITSQGWQVFRFTGSEIFKDPMVASTEVEEFIHKKMCESIGEAP